MLNFDLSWSPNVDHGSHDFKNLESALLGDACIVNNTVSHIVALEKKSIKKGFT